MDRLTRPDSLQSQSECQDPHCQDDSHRAERDSHVLDLLSVMIEASHVTIPMSGGKKHHSDPNRNCPVEKSIPGWRENVEPYREDAIFWHSVWKSAGSPSSGVLRNIMAKTRNQYHYSIRRVKKDDS